MKAEKDFPAIISNTPIADVLQFVSKNISDAACNTHGREAELHSLPWLRGVGERSLCLFASFFSLRKLGGTEEVLITSVKKQEVRILSDEEGNRKDEVSHSC